jgi:DNA invertase Pin-like site-specific DNA recombinase
MAIIGYARTSTADQQAGLDAQLRDLTAAGCTKVFQEKVSSVAERAQFTQCMRYLREGDVLVTTKPDRLARSLPALLALVEDFQKRAIGLIVLSLGGQQFDTRNPTSKLILTIMGSIAAWEREIMLERQCEGISKARGEGKYRGRKPTAMAKAEQIRALVASGMTKEAVAMEARVGIASVYRIMRANVVH